MQNLREAILGYRRALGQEVRASAPRCVASPHLHSAEAEPRTPQADEKRREAALLRGVEYLERYYTLIAFASYVYDPAFDAAACATPDGSFQAWFDRRPELQSIVRRLLWRNPMGALTPPTMPSADAVASQPPVADGGEAADAVVSGRAGGVLGAHCILKEEPYPGVQSTQLPVFHDGAPNFRQARPSRALRSQVVPRAAQPLTRRLAAGAATPRVRCGHLHAGWHPRSAGRRGRRQHGQRACAVVQHARRAVHLHRWPAFRPARGDAAAGEPVRMCVAQLWRARWRLVHALA